MFIVASKRHISAVGPWSKRIMIRHWRLVLSVSFLAVLAGMLTAWAPWAVETHSEQVDQKFDWAVETPREQLEQKIKLPPTPENSLYYEISTMSGESSADPECDLSNEGHDEEYAEYACEDVITKVTDPVKLASITEELRADPNSGSDAAQVGYLDGMSVTFSRSEQAATQFLSYCFQYEDLAADELRSNTDDAHVKLVLTGETDNCNIIVYEILPWR